MRPRCVRCLVCKLSPRAVCLTFAFCPDRARRPRSAVYSVCKERSLCVPFLPRAMRSSYALHSPRASRCELASWRGCCRLYTTPPAAIATLTSRSATSPANAYTSRLGHTAAKAARPRAKAPGMVQYPNVHVRRSERCGSELCAPKNSVKKRRSRLFRIRLTPEFM